MLLSKISKKAVLAALDGFVSSAENRGKRGLNPHLEPKQPFFFPSNAFCFPLIVQFTHGNPR